MDDAGGRRRAGVRRMRRPRSRSHSRGRGGQRAGQERLMTASSRSRSRRRRKAAATKRANEKMRSAVFAETKHKREVFGNTAAFVEAARSRGFKGKHPFNKNGKPSKTLLDYFGRGTKVPGTYHGSKGKQSCVYELGVSRHRGGLKKAWKTRRNKRALSAVHKRK